MSVSVMTFCGRTMEEWFALEEQARGDVIWEHTLPPDGTGRLALERDLEAFVGRAAFAVGATLKLVQVKPSVLLPLSAPEPVWIDG